MAPRTVKLATAGHDFTMSKDIDDISKGESYRSRW